MRVGLQVACAAGFEEVREHPQLHKTSTSLREVPEKSSTAMRAVDKQSPTQHCYAPETRHVSYIFHFFLGTFSLASTSA